MSTDGAPVFYTLDELAEILRLKSTRHLERNAARWPHIEIARQRLFTAADIEAIAELHRRGEAVTPEPIGGTTGAGLAGRVGRGKRGT